MGKFVYQDRDDELLKKRMETGGFSGGGVFLQGFNLYKPKVPTTKDARTTNKVRILPPTWDNAQHYGYEVWVHYNIGDDKNKSAFICNKRMGRGECPICEQIELHKSDKEYVDKIKAVRKVVVWLIDREEEAVGPKLWALSVTLDRKLAFQANDEDSGRVLKIDHPEKGYDVTFDTVKGAKEGIAFTYDGEKIGRQDKPIFADVDKMKTVLEFISEHPVTETLNFKDYDFIKGVFEGRISNTSRAEEEEKEEEKPHKEVKHEEEENPVDLSKMGRDELDDLAIDEFGMKNRDIKNLSDDELRRLIVEKSNGEQPEEKESSAFESAREKLAALKNR